MLDEKEYITEQERLDIAGKIVECCGVTRGCLKCALDKATTEGRTPDCIVFATKSKISREEYNNTMEIVNEILGVPCAVVDVEHSEEAGDFLC